MDDIYLQSGIGSEIILYLVIVAFVLIILIKGIKVVPEGRAKIVERLGRRNKTIYPGINIIIPFLDKVKIITEVVTTSVKGQSVSLIDGGAVVLAEQRMDPPSKLCNGSKHCRFWKSGGRNDFSGNCLIKLYIKV